MNEAMKTSEHHDVLQETLAPLTTELRQRLGDRLVALVLFGSRARGEATAASDWDLMLIAKGLTPKPFERHLYVKQLLPVEWRAVASVLAKTPEEFDVSLQLVYLDIAIDGIILYDRNRYITKRLKAIRNHLERQGLHRKQQGHNFEWGWTRSPQGEWSFEWDDVAV